MNRAKKIKDHKSWDHCRRSFNTLKIIGRQKRIMGEILWRLGKYLYSSRLRKVFSKDPGFPEFLMNTL